MMNIIQNNPYRILGVYAGASLKEITANKSHLLAYANIGKKIDIPTDLTFLLPEPIRTTMSINNAISQLTLPIDKVKFAMFWFTCGDSICEIALKHLQFENLDKASDLFEKKDTYSSYINRGILAFAHNKTGLAIKYITTMIHNKDYRESFVKAIASETFTINERDLSHLFIDTLLEEYDDSKLLELFKENGQSQEDVVYLKNLVISKPIQQIDAEIEKAKNIDRNDAIANYNAGINLIKFYQRYLGRIVFTIGQHDIQYQLIADKLANTVLQCGINYYNGSDEPDSVEKSLYIQNYALYYAVGNVVKDRCRDNVNILKKRKKQNAVSVDINTVANELKTFRTKDDTLKNASNLVDKCKPYLSNIKAVLGPEDDLYLKISSAVAGNALGMLISVCNANPDSKNTIKKAISVIELIGQLDMDSPTRLRLTKNSDVLSSNYITSNYSTGPSIWNMLLDGPLSTLLQYIAGIAAFLGFCFVISLVFEYPGITIPIIVFIIVAIVVYNIEKK